MKIQSLKYEDLSTGWKLDLTEFNPHLTLLVGVSGVGKTRILKALLNLRGLAHGVSDDFISWEIKIITETGSYIEWSGSCFEDEVEIDDEITQTILGIEYEKVFIDGKLVIDRGSNGIFFNKKETVKLSHEESVIYLLKEEPSIKNIYYSFDKIIHSKTGSHFTNENKYSLLTKEKLEQRKNKYSSLEKIRNSNDSLGNKLYFLYSNDRKVFDFFVDTYIDIFPYVQELKIGLVYVSDFLTPEKIQKVYPDIAIKENNISVRITKDRMSSGMFKTLIQLLEIYLAPDNSIILIDEFENSLGINCIDEVTRNILASERNLQFIITSHHPYIINNIPVSYWKVVTRNGNRVKTTDAEKLGVGRSKHQAFTQLANLSVYLEGIES